MNAEQEVAREDQTLLESFGPSAARKAVRTQSSLLKTKTGEPQLDNFDQAKRTETHDSSNKQERVGNKSKRSLKNHLDTFIASSDEGDAHKGKKNKCREIGSSEGSDTPRPRKKKSKKSKSKKKKNKESSSSSSPSSSEDSTSSSSESSSSEDSDDQERAELTYDVTEFESADLPDLPDRWDKGFKRLRSYVPVTLFKMALLESYYDDEKEQKAKDKSEWSKSALKNLEKQMTYGDFIEMCNLEERYAREIYGLDTYADYVVQHKKIVSDLKKSYNCWMIGLRYHLKVRTVIFRRRKLIKSKAKGKSVLKDKVKIPNGLQSGIERQARHDADRAGDLQFVDNPYAVGGPKYGHNFTTGRQSATTKVIESKEKGTDNAQSNAYRGKRGTGFKKPFAKRGAYPYNRFNRPYPEGQTGQ